MAFKNLNGTLAESTFPCSQQRRAFAINVVRISFDSTLPVADVPGFHFHSGCFHSV